MESLGSKKPSIRFKNVLLPEPDSPKIPILSFFEKLTFISSRVFLLLILYLKNLNCLLKYHLYNLILYHLFPNNFFLSRFSPMILNVDAENLIFWYAADT